VRALGLEGDFDIRRQAERPGIEADARAQGGRHALVVAAQSRALPAQIAGEILDEESVAGAAAPQLQSEIERGAVGAAVDAGRLASPGPARPAPRA
jgi:hypothetical protein